MFDYRSEIYQNPERMKYTRTIRLPLRWLFGAYITNTYLLDNTVSP